MAVRGMKWLWTCALALPLAAQAQVDLTTLDRDMAGPQSQVLVLGSMHLRDAPKSFRRESLQPLIGRLAAFNPDVITIEAIPGEQCDMVARHPEKYDPQDFAPYCGDTAAARAATGLDVPTAIAQVAATLREWPADPQPTQRRRLAALYLAANDRVSALVQWLQLPETERRAGEGLDQGLVTQLEIFSNRNEESVLIAARLAARLGLQGVHAVDDHTGDNVDVADGAAFGKAIQAAWDSASASVRPLREHEESLMAAGDMLALYRYINRPVVMGTSVDSDFGAALRVTSPQRFGQIYVAGWESRNLRMVANIREAFREHPGARVLSIVGSQHKPWFDSLLGQMQGVQIVDAQQVLK